KHGFDVLVYRSGQPAEPLQANQFLDGRVDGLLYWGGLRPFSYAELGRSRLPKVVLLDRPGIEGLAGVDFDDETGMRRALDHLVSLGHRRIDYVTGDVRLPHLRLRSD